MLLKKRSTNNVLELDQQQILNKYFSAHPEKTVAKKYDLFRFCFSHKGLDCDFTDEEFDKTFTEQTYEKEVKQ